MKLLVVVLIVFVALGGLLAILKARASAAVESGPWPFYVKRPLTSPEQVLYHRLLKALPDHIVLAQVQLSRFLGVKKSDGFHRWNNRINRLSVDFLVCGKDATVLAAIELDDSTHARPQRVATDAKKDKALTDAGVRIIRWNVKAMPDGAAIQAAVPTMPTPKVVETPAAAKALDPAA